MFVNYETHHLSQMEYLILLRGKNETFFKASKYFSNFDQLGKLITRFNLIYPSLVVATWVKFALFLIQCYVPKLFRYVFMYVKYIGMYCMCLNKLSAPQYSVFAN